MAKARGCSKAHHTRVQGPGNCSLLELMLKCTQPHSRVPRTRNPSKSLFSCVQKPAAGFAGCHFLFPNSACLHLPPSSLWMPRHLRLCPRCSTCWLLPPIREVHGEKSVCSEKMEGGRSERGSGHTGVCLCGRGCTPVGWGCHGDQWLTINPVTPWLLNVIATCHTWLRSNVFELK